MNIVDKFNRYFNILECRLGDEANIKCGPKSREFDIDLSLSYIFKYGIKV